jgi:hypothetical protein
VVRCPDQSSLRVVMKVAYRPLSGCVVAGGFLVLGEFADVVVRRWWRFCLEVKPLARMSVSALMLDTNRVEMRLLHELGVAVEIVVMGEQSKSSRRP